MRASFRLSSRDISWALSLILPAASLLAALAAPAVAGSIALPTGKAYVVNRDSNDVAVIDLGHLQVRARTPANQRPLGPPRSPGAATEGGIPAPARWPVVGRFAAGITPHQISLSPDGRYAYTTGQKSDTLTITRLADLKTVATLPLGRSPEHLAVSPDGRWVYVANFEEGSLSVVEGRRFVEVKRIGGFFQPHNITFSPDGRKAFVASLGSFHVSVVNVAAHTVQAELPAARPSRVASLSSLRELNGVVNLTLTPDGRLGLAAHGSAGELALIDARSDKVLRRLPLGGEPWRAYVGKRGRFALVPNLADRTVAVIDLRKGEIRVRLPGLKEMTGVNFALDDRVAFVVGRGEDKVRVLDLVGMRVLKDLPAGRSPETAATTPDGRFVVLAASGSQEVLVYDAARLALHARIGGVGRGPWGVYIQGGENYCH